METRGEILAEFYDWPFYAQLQQQLLQVDCSQLFVRSSQLSSSNSSCRNVLESQLRVVQKKGIVANQGFKF